MTEYVTLECAQNVMYLADLDKATNVKFVTILKETLGSPPNLFGLSNIERQIRVITTYSPEVWKRQRVKSSVRTSMLDLGLSKSY